jgi:hypothetical protein
MIRWIRDNKLTTLLIVLILAAVGYLSYSLASADFTAWYDKPLTKATMKDLALIALVHALIVSSVWRSK